MELASELLCPVAEAASIQPRVAAALASSALLHCMLLVAEQLASSSEEDAGGSVSGLACEGVRGLTACVQLLCSLHQAQSETKSRGQLVLQFLRCPDACRPPGCLPAGKALF